MSKIDDLRLNYVLVSSSIFTKFVEADTTPTKKYLEYYLKSWSYRSSNGCPTTTNRLIECVKKFDELLPYIENKDIYSKDYSNLKILTNIIIQAEILKEEKLFLRDDHAKVLIETDDYLLIRPLTHKGSLKYGANTKWCTASKYDEPTFQNYHKKGILVYLIDKKEVKPTNYQKIAFHYEYHNDSLSGHIIMYNSADSQISDELITKNGWSDEELFKFVMTMRSYFSYVKKTKKSKDYIANFVRIIQNMNFEEVNKHSKILGQMVDIDYITKMNDELKIFAEKLTKQVI